MKIFLKNVFRIIIILFLPIVVNAQNVITGKAASDLILGAETIRESNHSNLPSYIKLQKESQFDIDLLYAWMKSKMKFNPNMGFKLIKEDTDNIGHVHYKYQQTLNGKPIEDAFWIAHTKADKVYALNGLIYSDITTPLVESISENTALQAAKDKVGAEIYKWELPSEEKHLKWETGDNEATYLPKGELVFVANSGTFSAQSYRLAYKFDLYAHQPVYRAHIYVDAVSGAILRENLIIHHADEIGTAHTAYSGVKEITADSFEGTFRLRDASRGSGVRTFNLKKGTDYGAAVDFIDTDNIWNNVNPQKDEYATDAHWGASRTYDYFFDIHGRNSINNAGFQLNSYVHYSVGYVNAFWDGYRMTYGDGSGAYSPLTSIDIAGHEVTHGLTTFTAGLIYADESGALNESFSDIFGTSIEKFARPEKWNWLIGEDIGAAFRSMSNPNAFGDPDTYFGDYWSPLGGVDYGGVHSNSGVQNFWYYLLTEGGSGTNDNGDAYAVTSIGINASSAIAFRNLTVYLTSSSNFADARFYAIQAATDLYGTCSFEVEQTANAWYAVGVGAEFSPFVEADFLTTDTLGCSLPYTVNFTNKSVNAGTFIWDFGDGGSSTDKNPSHTYTEAGLYTVTLYADGGLCGTDEITFVNYINIDPTADCIVILPKKGTVETQTSCEGVIFDSGGKFSNYGPGEDAKVTIAPIGALSVSLDFISFDVEAGPGLTCNYDYLDIFDGPDEFSPLIDSYCNNNLPSSITSSGSSITIVFHSDGGAHLEGFEIEWTCIKPIDPPAADFTVNTEFACNGEIYFLDVSTNSPTSWFWDFGDGETSILQNPLHTYADNGTYSVKLIATNDIGSDELIKTELIEIKQIENPITTDATFCESQNAELSASGVGELLWYDAIVGGSLLNTGVNYTTPVLASTTTYYVESYVVSPSNFVGPVDKSYGGGGFFIGDQHLVFNCPHPVILKSVDVYANGAGNRIIELRNSTGDVLQSKKINIPNGASTVELNLNLPVGTNLQLGTAPGSLPNLFRNNAGVPAFPYTLPESVEITSTSAGSEYYYFFYNWEIVTYECRSERVPVNANLIDCASISENEHHNNLLSIYPNPTNGLININTGDLEEGIIEITDIVGKKIRTIPFNSSKFTVDMNDYNARGTYYILLKNTNGVLISTQRLVKQ